MNSHGKVRKKNIMTFVTMNNFGIPIKNEKNEFIEYTVIRSTQLIQQLESKSNFLCSFEIDYFKNLPRASRNLQPISHSNKIDLTTASNLGVLANKVQAVCGIVSVTEAPKFIYILKDVSEGDRLFMRLLDINFITDAFRFNPIQEDKVNALEDARYTFWIAKIGFMGIGILSKENTNEIKRKIQDNFLLLSDILATYLKEKCVPKGAKNLISAFHDEIKNCLAQSNYNAIEDVIAMLCEIYFRIPTSDSETSS